MAGWPDFKAHLHCNLWRECENGEDEGDCDYDTCRSGRGFQVDGTCYLLLRPSRPMSYADAVAACADRGGTLASLTTAREWTAVWGLLESRGFSERVCMGLTSAVTPFPQL